MGWGGRHLSAAVPPNPVSRQGGRGSPQDALLGAAPGPRRPLQDQHLVVHRRRQTLRGHPPLRHRLHPHRQLPGTPPEPTDRRRAPPASTPPHRCRRRQREPPTAPGSRRHPGPRPGLGAPLQFGPSGWRGRHGAGAEPSRLLGVTSPSTSPPKRKKEGGGGVLYPATPLPLFFGVIFPLFVFFFIFF